MHGTVRGLSNSEQQAEFNRRCVGQTLPVLFTGRGRHRGQVAGRSPYLQPVHISGSANLIGRVAPVRIAAALPNSLAGTVNTLDQKELACA